MISWIFTTFTGSTTTKLLQERFNTTLWLAEFLLPLQGQQQQPRQTLLKSSVVISWIFTTFTGSTTTFQTQNYISNPLWLAEFLLPLQGQQQRPRIVAYGPCVVISWIFTTFTGSTTTILSDWIFCFVLWLAEFLLPLQGQQQPSERWGVVACCCD